MALREGVKYFVIIELKSKYSKTWQWREEGSNIVQNGVTSFKDTLFLLILKVKAKNYLMAWRSSAVFCANCRDFSMARLRSSDHFSIFDFFSTRFFSFSDSRLSSICRTFCRASSWRCRRSRTSEAIRNFLWLKTSWARSSAARIDLIMTSQFFHRY